MTQGSRVNSENSSEKSIAKKPHKKLKKQSAVNIREFDSSDEESKES